MNKVHDLSDRAWGNNYSITSFGDDGINIRLCGWCYGISQGDYLILKNGEDTTRYKVDHINYLGNPGDMWSASATFSPR